MYVVLKIKDYFWYKALIKLLKSYYFEKVLISVVPYKLYILIVLYYFYCYICILIKSFFIIYGFFFTNDLKSVN